MGDDSMSSLPPKDQESDRLLGNRPEDFVYSILNSDDTNKRVDHSTNWFDTLVHLIKASVGTGLLALPLAVRDAGLIVGGAALILLGIIATHCMFQLVNAARELTKRYPLYQTLNYSQVTELALSQHIQRKWVIKVTGVIVNFFLMITQFGFCCVYFVFMAENIRQVLCSAFGVEIEKEDLLVKWVWISILILPMVVSCWIKNFDHLSSFSTIANFFILFCLLVIFYQEMNLFVSKDPKQQAAIIRPRNVTDTDGHGGGVNYFPTQVTTGALFFGNAIFSFEGIGIVLPLENKIKKPGQFKWVLALGMAIVVFLYVSVGILGYVAYGESIKASITLNLQPSYEKIPESIIFLLVRAFYAYVIFASFLVQFYVPMDFLEPPLLRCLNRCCKWKKHFPSRWHLLNTPSQIVFRTIVVVVIAAIALALPDLGDLISLIGAMASSCLALIFPPLLDILVFAKDNNSSAHTSMPSPEPVTKYAAVSNEPTIQNNVQAQQNTTRSLRSVLYWIVWFTKNILIILLGVFGFGIGTYAAINGLVVYFENDSKVIDTCVKFLN